MKSRLKYDLSIFLRWGMVSIICLAFTLPSKILAVDYPPWHIDLEAWDKRKLRSNWTYLVEGKGGLGVLIGENEAMVERILGRPTRRSFGTMDELYFERRTFTGTIYMYHGLVSRIRYIAADYGSESLKWHTALKLRQSMIDGLSEADAAKTILDHYGNPQHLVKKGSLLVYSRGILFVWTSGKLRYIEIFEPWTAPPAE